MLKYWLLCCRGFCRLRTFGNRTLCGTGSPDDRHLDGCGGGFELQHARELGHRPGAAEQCDG